jgi:site-specific DNA-cytosine methylase
MNQEKINVLSLFDGMSCGQIALERAGIEVKNYFASEIDKYAIKVTQANYPNTKQLGSVLNVKGADLPNIDLLIGGSPCQGFSFAGKQLNFDDPRSKLFFEFIRLKNECSPSYFMLENVVMKKEYQDIISSYLGVEPIMINSNLVSAQNRKRLYWTNIPNIKQPNDKYIFIEDIIQNGSALTNKSQTIVATIYKENAKSMIKRNKKGLLVIIDDMYKNRPERIYEDKSPTLRSERSGLKVKNEYEVRKLSVIECERLQTVPHNYTNYVSDTQRYKMLGNGWTVDLIAHIFKGLKNNH